MEQWKLFCLCCVEAALLAARVRTEAKYSLQVGIKSISTDHPERVEASALVGQVRTSIQVDCIISTGSRLLLLRLLRLLRLHLSTLLPTCHEAAKVVD